MKNIILTEMEKYRCIICGYIYDPEVGEISNGIKAGVGFNELPADYVCPVCGAEKEDFMLYE
jgi:rubredoxin